MIVTRRRVIEVGGGLIAALAVAPEAGAAAGTVEVTMRGKADGSVVWFDPIGIRILPGQTIRWTNRDAGNVHTTTSYNPANFDRPLRMPAAAPPWDSGYLMPDETFSVTFTEKGVYDYYCVPHEHAGMVGRIVVGAPDPQGWLAAGGADGDIPELALQAFPADEEIMAKGAVRRA